MGKFDIKPTIKNNVALILQNSVKARNDDKILMWIYWKYVDKINMENLHLEFVAKATKPGSIIRARSLLQAEGKYLSDAETARRRAHREMSMRHNISHYKEVPEEVPTYYPEDEEFDDYETRL